MSPTEIGWIAGRANQALSAANIAIQFTVSNNVQRLLSEIILTRESDSNSITDDIVLSIDNSIVL